MDNLNDRLEITKSTKIEEVIDYAVKLYKKHNPTDLTEEEVRKYAGNVWQHSKSVHFYLDRLGISIDDESENPHDLVGPGNKLKWKVMHGLAYAEKDTLEKKKIFEKALERHRIQRHHRMWNREDDKWTDEDMKYGAIDAVVSLLENREYQGGSHTWKEIQKIIDSEPRSEYQTYWMNWTIDEMKKVTPLLKNLEIWISSLLQGNNKNSEEKNNSSN